MTLGEKLRQTRLEAGLSQKALCGDRITRNMLSLIESGSARPSMDTLVYLAQQLGKSVGFFLDEDAPVDQARALYAQGDYAQALELLTEGPEADLLRSLCLLELADQAIREEKLPYARQLLGKIDLSGIYAPLILRQYRLLTAQATAQPLDLPFDDRELLLRARDALSTDPARSGQYLDAAQDRADPHWHLLRGRAYLALARYEKARDHLLIAEPHYPSCAADLEQCFEKLEDFKNAYLYAKKRRAGQ